MWVLRGTVAGMATRSSSPWHRTRAELPAGPGAVAVVVYLASALAVVLGVALALPGLTSVADGLRYPVTADDVTSARAALATLAVKGRAPRTGYDRAAFGPAWQDVDRNGCDTRNDILGRDLTGIEFKPGTRDCLVLGGTLADPYSGREIAFARGAETSANVQIDHVVALSDAWQKGAQAWPATVREAFGNDPANLLAVDGPLNQAKGAADAATWLPPHKPYRCRYVLRQVRVKVAYGLWVTAAEGEAMARELGRCEIVPKAESP